MDSGDPDRDPKGGGRRVRDQKRKGCWEGPRAGGERVQASYRGSREPAGQAGRREGRRRSYSPWWSRPCREAGTDVQGQDGNRRERQTRVSTKTLPSLTLAPLPPPLPLHSALAPLCWSLSQPCANDASPQLRLPLLCASITKHQGAPSLHPRSSPLSLTHSLALQPPAPHHLCRCLLSLRTRLVPDLSLCASLGLPLSLAVAASDFSHSEPRPLSGSPADPQMFRPAPQRSSALSSACPELAEPGARPMGWEGTGLALPSAHLSAERPPAPACALPKTPVPPPCLLYTSDAADERK